MSLTAKKTVIMRSLIKSKAGDALIIRYEGPRGSGMPEMLMTTESIVSDKDLNGTVSLVTDGRFWCCYKRTRHRTCISGGSSRSGEIAYIKDGDIICFDIPKTYAECSRM